MLQNVFKKKETQNGKQCASGLKYSINLCSLVQTLSFVLPTSILFLCVIQTLLWVICKLHLNHLKFFTLFVHLYIPSASSSEYVPFC